MSLPSMDLLVGAVMQPESIQRFSLPDWDWLIRQGRTSDTLARLGCRLKDAGLWEAVPGQVARHLLAAMSLAERQHVELGYEVQAISKALAAQGIPVVLLKGAAYVQAGLAAAKGRMVSDVDILVARARLGDAESALMKAGWVTTLRDEYDQRYYRTWMHEIPPMRHLHRGTVLDVHHAIVPPTAGYGMDSDLLLREARLLDAEAQVCVLAPADMVLHSAVHLMHEGELELGFRGLLDLDALVSEFSMQADFWDQLCRRAEEHHLQWPLFLALRYTQDLLGTPVPQEVVQRLRHRVAERAAGWRLQVLDFLYHRALRPTHASLADRWSGTARQVLYLRSHGLRMSPFLLLPHLLRKGGKRLMTAMSGDHRA